MRLRINHYSQFLSIVEMILARRWSKYGNYLWRKEAATDSSDMYLTSLKRVHCFKIENKN
jgi:hypothetical protein